MPAHAKPAHQVGRAIVRTVLSVAMLAVAVLAVGTSRLVRAAVGVSPGCGAVAVGAALACMIVRWARWHLLASAGISGLSWRHTATSLLAGSGVSLASHPWTRRLRGAVLLAREERQGLAGLALLDTILELTVAVSALAVILFGPTALAVVAVGLALLFSLLPHVTRLQWTTRGTVQRLACALDKTSVPVLMVAIVLSVAAYGAEFLEFAYLLRALGGDGWTGPLRAFPFVVTARLVPIGIPGVGLPQCVAAIALSSQGQGAHAVLATVAMLVLNTLVPCLVAAASIGSRACNPPEA